MKTRYKYIHFDPVASHSRTPRYACRNNRTGVELGIVAWYAPWRQFCFSPSGPSVFSGDCLADIQGFLQQLMAARKATGAQ